MKKILTIALSVMVFTGVMAQQKTKEASLKAKSSEELKLNEKNIESAQSANAEGTLNTKDLKSKAEEQKNLAKQKVKDKKEATTKKVADASADTEVGVGATVGSNTHGTDVSATAQSDVTTGTKGAVVSNVASVKNKGNVAVKAAGNLSGNLNTSVKTVPADVKVKTDVHVKPKAINAKVKTASGIKL